MNKPLAAICLLTNLAFAQQSTDLVGRWRSVETSKGGIGAMYDFSPDGNAHFSPGAIVPMKYRLDGDLLRTLPEEGPPFTLSWTGDDKLRLAVGGDGEDYLRLGARPDAANRLLGEWTGTRNMEGRAVVVHWIFNADSTALLMIRFLTVDGRYEARDGRLVATFGNQPGLSGPIKFTNGILSIQRGAGKVTRLQRY